MAQCECLAIVPARGGSKGIPGKNLAIVGGRPLLCHILDAAQNTTKITRLIVSTDDLDIMAVAQQMGVETITRPAAISNDTASSEAAMLHVLRKLSEKERYHPDLTVLLQCTSPLTTSADIDGAICNLAQKQADSCLTASVFHHFLWQCDLQGTASGLGHDDTKRQRRQEMAPLFLENGAVYVMRTDGFLKHQFRFFGKTVIFQTPQENHLEIDNPRDLDIAEILFDRRKHSNSVQALPVMLAALILDFDGVMTDNRCITDQNGIEAITCDRSDGLGIELLQDAGIRIVTISKERNPVVTARSKKLGIEVFQGIDNKLPLMQQWLEENNINVQQTIYVGNDINDIDCLLASGCGVVPSDAHWQAKQSSNIILSKSGGKGAIRELSDLMFAAVESGHSRFSISSDNHRSG